MDRIDAMKVFVATLDEGSLAGAGRRLGRSPAAVSRAIAFLEEHTGTPLLYRTTRTIRLSDAGERYALACRRILADLEEADLLAADERSAPHGLLGVTAAVAVGEEVLRPMIEAFIDRHPEVSIRLHLLDRPVSLIDEGIDVALRIAHLQDSTLVAIPVGEVRRVVVASPGYLGTHPTIAAPADLASHAIISMTHFGLDSWSFPAARQTALPQVVQFSPRFIVNTIRAARASAVAGHGVTRLFSYHVAEEVEAGRLKIVLRDSEHAPLPVNLVTPHGRLSVPKVRSFVDFAAPRLREYFEQAQRITEAG
ncbi:LysR family transcriptional regulator [Trinickia symbiotica]|uniref:LysR family transcriptional regulator n=1 Tax=Trinickia symbiotica TaxID=863227 RepID=A0A2N7WN61_9BURK|nr:LysR family transcriptional regulator [Trinickia symbiotica]PMS30870.1 LysR family transcriptional regulator [Trinickia symbiotica]PPK41646.1 LysR family transcriptional regulator [Trinickia symbiotica]